MTCIVGYIDKKTKKTIIGADSAGCSGNDITVRKDEKVFKVGDFVIGCTSSFRMIQLLRFSFEPPKIEKEDIYEYMCVNFINAVRQCFKKGGYLQKYEAGDEKGGVFLVAYKDFLFKIEEDFQVGISEKEFDAVGCGYCYALGSLYTNSNNEISTEKKVLKALKCASYFSGAVREPFIIKST